MFRTSRLVRGLIESAMRKDGFRLQIFSVAGGSAYQQYSRNAPLRKRLCGNNPSFTGNATSIT